MKTNLFLSASDVFLFSFLSNMDVEMQKIER